MSAPILAPMTEQGLRDTFAAINQKWYLGDFASLGLNFQAGITFEYPPQSAIAGNAACLQSIADFRNTSTQISITGESISSASLSGIQGVVSYQLNAEYTQAGDDWIEENQATFTFSYQSDRWYGVFLLDERTRRKKKEGEEEGSV